MASRPLTGLIVLIVLMLVARVATAQSGWTPTDLRTLPGCNYSIGRAINAAGQVVGSSGEAPVGHPEHAFLWSSSGGMTDLGTLPGFVHSTAYGINDAGHVVGWSRTSTVVSIDHAFLWTAADGMSDLGTLGGASSRAYDINNVGQVVGYSTTVGGITHAFLSGDGAAVTTISVTRSRS